LFDIFAGQPIATHLEKVNIHYVRRLLDRGVRAL
jgi:hypothetical protein